MSRLFQARIERVECCITPSKAPGKPVLSLLVQVLRDEVGDDDNDAVRWWRVLLRWPDRPSAPAAQQTDSPADVSNCVLSTPQQYWKSNVRRGDIWTFRPKEVFHLLTMGESAFAEQLAALMMAPELTGVPVVPTLTSSEGSATVDLSAVAVCEFVCGALDGPSNVPCGPERVAVHGNTFALRLEPVRVTFPLVVDVLPASSSPSLLLEDDDSLTVDDVNPCAHGKEGLGESGCGVRCEVFGKWILETFSSSSGETTVTDTFWKNPQSSGDKLTTIVDVGGGKGDLAALLALSGVGTVLVVDPRPSSGRLKTRVRKMVRRAKRRVDAWRIYFPPELTADHVVSLPISEAREIVGLADLANAVTVAGEAAGALREEIRRTWLTRESSLMDCDVIVGFHPDEATEPIIDWALAHSKAFAVVPCCVFSRVYPSRVTPSGMPVRSHAEFIEYLLGKSAKIRSSKITIEGPNTVLWYRPEAAPCEEN